MIYLLFLPQIYDFSLQLPNISRENKKNRSAVKQKSIIGVGYLYVKANVAC